MGCGRKAETIAGGAAERARLKAVEGGWLEEVIDDCAHESHMKRIYNDVVRAQQTRAYDTCKPVGERESLIFLLAAGFVAVQEIDNGG